MYKEGDFCTICGRLVVKFDCFCGDGKPNERWTRVTDECPACAGKGYNYRCPIIISLGEDLRGITCKSLLI